MIERIHRRLDVPRLKQVPGRVPVGMRGLVVAVLTDVRTGKRRQVVREPNLVMNTGLIHYATVLSNEIGGGGAAINDYDTLELGNAGDAPAAGSTRANMTGKVANSLKVVDAAYPMNNDADADNPGPGNAVVSFRVTYGTSEANDAAIDRCIVTENTPGSSAALLMYATFTAFEKTASDTLKFFVNHTVSNP